MNPWINEWRNGWMNERMDGRGIFLLSYFFTERPLCWGTSSLSYFFSEQPLIWATSARSSCVASATQVFSSRSCYTMRLAASSCNPASHRSSAMVKNYLSRSCYYAFSNFQLQSRLLAASLASLMLCWFCHSRLQTRKIPHSRSVWPNNGDDSAVLRECSFQNMFSRPLYVKSSSRYSLIHFLPTYPTSSSKSAPNASVFRHWSCALFVDFPDRAARPRKQRPEQNARVSKPRVFSPVSVFNMLPKCYTSQVFDDGVDMLMWLTWWCGWHDDGVDMLMWLTCWWNAKHDYRP